MADTISVSIIITFAAELLFSLVLPILALVIWKKKEGSLSRAMRSRWKILIRGRSMSLT